MSTRFKRKKSGNGLLSERLLAQQPHSRSHLDKLNGRFDGRHLHGAFAAIEHGLCEACHVRVAATYLQRARLGEFIMCSCCARFLYVAEEHAAPRGG